MLWGVAFLLGLLDPPSKPEMERDVATWNVWTRKRYVVQGPKNAYGIYEFTSYINVLLKDLGGHRSSSASQRGELICEIVRPDVSDAVYGHAGGVSTACCH